LIEFAQSVSHGKGFLIVAAVVPEAGMNAEREAQFEKSTRAFLQQRKVNALTEIVSAENTMSGAKNLIRHAGIGPLFPNTIVLGSSQSRAEGSQDLADLILTAYHAGRNAVVIPWREVEEIPPEGRKIDVWWGRENRKNTGLMLALAYMLLTSRRWRGAELRLRSLIRTEVEREGALKHLEEFLENGRIDATPDVTLINEGSSAIARIPHLSKDADLLFVGLRPPEEGDSPETYAAYFENLLETMSGTQGVVFVLGAQNIDFQSIFES
jgi:hypothetical protein